MSLLYKPKEEQITEVEISRVDGKINLLFSSDCGKFGMSEPLDEYTLTPDKLLEILQDRDDYSEEEI